MATAAKPLKIANSTPAKSNSASSTSTLRPGTGGASSQNNDASMASVPQTSDITSPHELISFVDNLLENLDSKFDDMTAQFIDRMNQMSSDVDKLESSIQDIINSDVAPPGSLPQSPGPGTPGFGGPGPMIKRMASSSAGAPYM